MKTSLISNLDSVRFEREVQAAYPPVIVHGPRFGTRGHRITIRIDERQFRRTGELQPFRCCHRDRLCDYVHLQPLSICDRQ